MQVSLDNLISELLQANGITPAESTTYAKIYWSLSHSQGDGAMFEGTFDWGKYRVYIKQSGRYYHSNSATIEIQEADNLGFHMDDEHADVIAFDVIYQKICKELERAGYEAIEWELSETAFVDACNSNEWTFRENGKIENA